MKFRRVGAKLIETRGRQTDIKKLKGAFRQDANASKYQSVTPVLGNNCSEPCTTHKDIPWVQLEFLNVKADGT